ncbi:MAG: hypothetical protein NWE89_07680 [Candidatus Bathyarchaeota archaeon]|nr:hypothetical protein [Candidatus Bathyarchaeota archaeon]
MNGMEEVAQYLLLLLATLSDILQTIVQNLVSGLFVVLGGFIMFFIVNPYRRYYAFRDTLASSAIRHSYIIYNIDLAPMSYTKAQDEINGWIGEINVIRNKLILNNYLSRFRIPSSFELEEALKMAIFIRNTLNQKEHIIETHESYQRLMEIFDINQSEIRQHAGD